jgi:hypothetical protein
MYAVAAFSLASTIATMNELSAFDDLTRSVVGVTASDLAAAEQMSEGFVGLAFWVGAAAGGVTIVWWYRSYRAILGTDPESVSWSPRWAVWGWFIPLANIVIPKLVLNEIDRVSTAAEAGEDDWRSQPLTVVANWWWGAWVTGVVLSFAGATIVASEAVALDFNASAYRAGLQMTAAGFAVSTVAGFLGAATMRLIGERLHASID